MEAQSTPVSQELTVAEAVDRRLGQLAPSEEIPKGEIEDAIDATEASQEEAATEETSEEVTAEEEESTEEDETEEEEQEAPVSEDEDNEAETEDEAEEEEEEPGEVIYQIEIDGKLVEKTLDDLKRSPMFQADYTRKTQELAKEREGVTAQKEQFAQSLNATAAIMEMALQTTGDELAKFKAIDWAGLQKDDPHEFSLQYPAYQHAINKRAELEGQAGQLVQAQQQLQNESTQARIATESQALIQAMPDMADVKKGPELMKSIKTYATEKMGLTQFEADNIIDHRVVVALNKARLFDEMDGKVKSVAAKKRSKAPKKTVKPGSPTSKSQVKSEHVTQMRQKAKQSGSTADAAEALLASRNVI